MWTEKTPAVTTGAAGADLLPLDFLPPPPPSPPPPPLALGSFTFSVVTGLPITPVTAGMAATVLNRRQTWGYVPRASV